MNELQTLKTFATSVVERSTAAGATSAEVYVRQGRESEIQVRDGQIDVLQEGQPKSVGIRLWRDDRVASTYATDFSDASITRLITDTLELAKLTDPVPEAALVDAPRLATALPALDLIDRGIPAMDAAEKLDRILACERAALDFDPRIARSGGAGWSDATSAGVLANSHGFCEGYEGSYAYFNVEVIADDEGGKKRNGSWYSIGRHRDQLKDAAEVGRIAGERTIRQLGAGPVPTATLPVVFDPRAGAALIGLLFSVMKGDPVERGRSFLIEKLGDLIASPLVTIIDDPLIARGPGSRPIDGEGLPARKTTFVDHGRLMQWAVNSMNARKLGIEPTGHASRPASGAPGESGSNLYLAAGDRDPAEIISEVEYGFYCEGMMGFGFNPATGDFSRGASGRLIENGELTRPVSEVTVSANFLDLFGAIDAVGSDLELDRSVAAPTFRVAKMTLGGS